MRKLLFIFLTTFTACSDQSSTTTTVTDKTNNKDSVKEELNEQKPATDSPANAGAALTISNLENTGDQGQITFSQKEKAVFFYNHKTKKGEIVLNNTKYVLDKYAFDSKKETYEISNKDVKIITGPCKFKENNGSDCFYGTIKDITITTAGGELILNNVDVQDCPDN